MDLLQEEQVRFYGGTQNHVFKNITCFSSMISSIVDIRLTNTSLSTSFSPFFSSVWLVDHA